MKVMSKIKFNYKGKAVKVNDVLEVRDIEAKQWIELGYVFDPKDINLNDVKQGKEETPKDDTPEGMKSVDEMTKEELMLELSNNGVAFSENDKEKHLKTLVRQLRENV